MPRVALNDREQDALIGLPWIAQLLYLAIRASMDYATGRAGVAPAPLLSWQRFRERLYVDPAPGIRGGAPSRFALDRAADQLGRRGLVRRLIGPLRSGSDRPPLVFELPLADRDTSPEKKPHQSRTKSRTAFSEGESMKAAHPPPIKAAPHPGSGITNPLRSNSTVTTRAPAATVEGDAAPIDYPPGIVNGTRDAIAAELAGTAPAIAQAIVDELAGAMRSAAGVKNPAAYVRALARKGAAGVLTFDHAATIRAEREQRQRNAQALAAAGAPAAPAAPVPRAAPAGAREAMRAALKRGARHA